MNLIISNAAGQPIYEQIYTQLKQLILSGELHEGDALPSMRVLAKELRISVITTKRAYEELERDGFLVTVAGKGSLRVWTASSCGRSTCGALKSTLARRQGLPKARACPGRK